MLIVIKMEYGSELEFARVCAWEAGKELRQLFRSGSIEVSEKGFRDIVTSADKKSEKLILDRIERRFPSYGIVSEEYGEKKANSEFTWVVDPLDGSFNFSRGIPLYCIAMALQKNDATVLGVIYAPETGDLVYAVKGEGTFYRVRRSDKRLAVSQTNSLEDAAVMFNSGHEDRDRKEFSRQFSKFGNINKFRIYGSAAYVAILVARGDVDGYIRLPSMPVWDTAAAGLIVEEAGGKVTDAEDRFVMSNAALHEKLLEVLRK